MASTPKSRTRPIHVAFFNRAFFPETSATSQLLTELAQGLSRDYGYQISVVAGVPFGLLGKSWTPPKGPWITAYEKYGAITILRARGTHFSKRRFSGRVLNYITYFLSACITGQRLERPDVVIALTDPPIVGLAAWGAAMRFRCPLVISYRDLFPEVGRLLEDFHSSQVDWVLERINRILIARSTRVIALGQAMRQRLLKKGATPEQVAIIPDWADCSEILPGPKDNFFSRAHGLTDRFVVMHSGNMGVSQNLEVLIETARRLASIPDLIFVFVGEGIKKSALEQQAKQLKLSNVLFLPYEPKENLTNSFASADCFIVSLKPGLAGCIMPSKLYGILAAGRPFVAAVDPECDVARIAQEHDCGLLAKTDDPGDLEQKILQLYRDRSLGSRLGAHARKAAEQFDRPRGVKAYQMLIDSLAEKR